MMDCELEGDAKAAFEKQHGDAFAADNEGDDDAAPTMSDMMDYAAADLTGKCKEPLLIS